MDQYTIGVDVGGTKTAYGVFDEQGNLVCKRKLPSDAGLSPQAFFDTVAEGMEEAMRQCGVAWGEVEGIGLAMPSYIRYEDGYILKTSNLTNIREFAARDYLQKKLGRKVRVVLDNDAHAAALAEHRYGAGRGYPHMLYCPVSTGISSGIIIDGKLFRGRYGWAGESGHAIITPGEGLVCGCGNRGCLMSWCSGSMIVRHIQNWIADGEDSLLVELAGGAQNITARHLDAAWDAGDPLTVRAVDQMVKYMAVWLFNLYVTFNIDCFVFGGGLLRMGDKLFGPLRKQFDAYNQDDAHPVVFREAELGEDFGIIGAAELLVD